MHGELLRHFNGLKRKRILIDADTFQSKNFTKLTKPAVGRERRLFWGQDNLIKDNFLKNKGNQCQNNNRCNGTQEVPAHHLKVLKERHFPFIGLTHFQSG